MNLMSGKIENPEKPRSLRNTQDVLGPKHPGEGHVLLRTHMTREPKRRTQMKHGSEDFQQAVCGSGKALKGEPTERGRELLLAGRTGRRGKSAPSVASSYRKVIPRQNEELLEGRTQERRKGIVYSKKWIAIRKVTWRGGSAEWDPFDKGGKGEGVLDARNGLARSRSRGVACE